MHLNRVIRYNPVLTTIVALVVVLGSAMGGAQVAHAGLSGSDSGHRYHKAERGARPGVPTTKSMVAKWWQWYLGIPGDMHPITNEKYCNQGQSGKVWFLVSGDFNRNCTVPAGKDILVPIINAECSTLEAEPFFGEDEEALRACVEQFFTKGDVLFFRVDGKEVGNPLRFRRQSRLFEFTLADPPPPSVELKDSNLELPAVGESIADGYYVRVKHLSVGEHVIEFSATLGPDSLFAGFGFSGSWKITVE